MCAKACWSKVHLMISEYTILMEALHERENWAIREGEKTLGNKVHSDYV